MSEKEEGFNIVDNRGKGKEEAPATEKKGRSSASGGETPPPPLNFSTFILSLSSSAFLHFGEIPDPATGKKEANLPFAKQSIDMLDMLKEKTKGNLDDEECKLLENILCELKLKYTEMVKKER